MCVCAHFSQRATCPPSAAVRQRLDRRHDLELAEAHMAGVGSAPRRPVGAEDIRDLQRRAGQERRASTRAASPSWRDARAGS